MPASCQFKTSNLENASSTPAYHMGFCEDQMNHVLVGTQQTLALIFHLRHLLKVTNPSSGQRVREDQTLGVKRC